MRAIGRRIGILIGAMALAAAFAAPAQAAPVLDVDLGHDPAAVPAGTSVHYRITVANTGDAVASAPIAVALTMPAGLKATAVLAQKPIGLTVWSCSIGGGGASVNCTGPSSGLPGPGQEACEPLSATCRIKVTATTQPGLEPGDVATPSVEACGGGAAACASDSEPTPISTLRFELADFDGGVFDQLGDPVTQAGSHPAEGWTEFNFTRVGTPGWLRPSGTPRDVVVDLPPGLVGNPQVVDPCPATAVVRCPLDAQVGKVGLVAADFITDKDFSPADASLGPLFSPVFRMQEPEGTPAVFKFLILGTPIYVTAKVRTGEDYGVTVSALDAPIAIVTYGVKFTFWGVPADPSHNSERGYVNATSDETCAEGSAQCNNPSSLPRRPFLTLPTSCTGPVDTHIAVTSWEGESDKSFFTSHDAFGTPIGNEGCGALDFSPTLEARPTTNVADSPSGLDVNLHIPQSDDPDGTATAHLKDTVVTLPEGLVINPSGANGLDGCSSAEADLHSEAPSRCPEASKLGTVSVETPVLEDPVPGAVYIADPYDNPFNSLLALYIAIDDPKSGVVVKLPGEVRADPVSGQITATFENNPQLPFEDFHLRFFGGAGGSLRTPATCGTYATTSSMTPWSAPDSGPPDTPSDTWAITQGPGGACASVPAQLPNTPSFEAGTAAPIAGSYSPLVMNLRRQDGTQQFKSITLTPPQGLVGKLAGVATCPDSALAAAAAKSGRAEEASPSCPQASYLGAATAAAGAGPAPYHAAGKAYLTGPYKGAPLSLAILTPATAGPFDLGTIVVKTALYVDRKTAQITAVSDPIPHILQGIPLDVRSVQVKLDRPEFTLNPTSCDPSAFGGELVSLLGLATPLQSRFQVGECGRLGFKPKLSLSLKGATKRNGYPALTAVLEPRAGDANLASISVALPHSEFLAQEHIRTVCTRVQFAADQCPAGAVYGTATVTTPLLDYPLTGPVYLRSSDNLLPDLVPDLRGPAHQPIKLESAGRTDSVNGGIRNTFDFVPDAPFTKLVLKMQGGKKGLLVNSRDICARTERATVKYSAHNGATLTARPALKAQCSKKGKRGKGKSKSRRGHSR